MAQTYGYSGGSTSSSWYTPIPPLEIQSSFYSEAPADTSRSGPNYLDYNNNALYCSVQDVNDSIFSSSYADDYNSYSIPEYVQSNRAPATQTRKADNLHICAHPSCGKAFKRWADLERHYNQVHPKPSTKTNYFCDYSKCVRRSDAFHRIDHFRDHYRDFHKEDLPRKKGEGKDWYDSRVYRRHWWRCSKCLERKYVENEGWNCTSCSADCDAVRREMRESLGS